MQAIEFTELEAPASFYSEKEVGAVVLGRVLFRDDRRPVVLALEDWYGDHCASMLRSENSRHRVSGHIGQRTTWADRRFPSGSSNRVKGAPPLLTQLDDPTATAVFGNVGSIINFQVGSDDEERLPEQLGKSPGQITPEYLTGLPKYTVCVRLLIDGMPSKPFSMQTTPPPSDAIDPERAEIIRRVTQRSFGNAVRPVDVRALKV